MALVRVIPQPQGDGQGHVMDSLAMMRGCPCVDHKSVGQKVPPMVRNPCHADGNWASLRAWRLQAALRGLWWEQAQPGNLPH